MDRCPFGLLQPGHPVRFDVTATQEGKWACSLAPPQRSELVVVFLTGHVPCPPGFGLGVYVSRQTENCFEYLGSVTNQRPSGVFRLPTRFTPVGAAEGAAAEVAEQGEQQAAPAAVHAAALQAANVAGMAAANTGLVCGISLEPLQTLSNLDGGPLAAGPLAAPGWANVALHGEGKAKDAEQQQPGFRTAPSTAQLTWKRGAVRLANDLSAWLGSFTKEDDTSGQSYLVLPADFVARWLQKVQVKLQRQPEWLDSAGRIEQTE